MHRRCGPGLRSGCAVLSPHRASRGPARGQDRLHEPMPVHTAAGVDESDQQVDRFVAQPVRAEAQRGDGRGRRRVIRILTDARHQQIPRHSKPMVPGGGEDVVTGVGVDADDSVRSWIAVEQPADRVPFSREVVGQRGVLLDEGGQIVLGAPGGVGASDQVRVLVVVPRLGECDPPSGLSGWSSRRRRPAS